MEDLICYFNGKYLEEADVKLTLYDAALMEGMIYTARRTYNHVPHFWKEHTDALFRSLRAHRINPGLTWEEMHNINLEVFRRNENYLEEEDDFIVVQRVSRGGSRYFFDEPAHPTILTNCLKVIPLYNRQAKIYKEGIHLVVASTRQIPPQCLDVKTKNTNRLSNTLANLEVRMVDPEARPLMLDIYGRVSEGSTYNFFAVRDGKLLTPKRDNIYPGVTRATILKLAKEVDIEASETDLYVYDLYNADEMFITANSYTIAPVSRFNQTSSLNPVPGEITQRLLSAFSRAVGVDIVQRVVGYVERNSGSGS
jgi:branched-chain amino acid aminotransferase